MDSKNILIIITIETYLRNWLACGTFSELKKHYSLHYAVVKYDWDPETIKKYGVNKYSLLSQKLWRKNFLLKFLLITMIKYSRKAAAFRIKIHSNIKPLSRFFHSILSLPIIYNLLHKSLITFFPIWKELRDIINDIKPNLIIMPSLAADAWTIDMILTARKMKVKSFVLINSWDNLVSKGVIPMYPDCLGVWGQQGVNQAVKIQKVPMNRTEILGSPRFEMYFQSKPNNSKKFICNYNSIPINKKILLFAATVLPFDDCGAMKTLDEEIENNRTYCDFCILYRPHPEMMHRNGERHFKEYNYKHVFLDKQMEEFYELRFKLASNNYPSFINKTDLDYYPKLMAAVDGIISAPTTLSLEGSLNGIPCLMICYNDGYNNYLSPEKMCKYENVREILAFPGMIPCYDKKDLITSLCKLIEYSRNSDIKQKMIKASEFVVFRDNQKYPERIKKVVDKILTER